MSSTSWLSLPASNPGSPYYVPPAGMYQNNAGQVVPNSVPNITFPTSPTLATVGTSPVTAASVIAASTPSTSIWTSLKNFSLEDGVFIILGLILIIAGIFSFKATQDAVKSGVSAGSKIAEVAAA